MSEKKILHVISVSFVINHFFGNQFSHFNKKGYKFFVACSEDEQLFLEANEKGFTPFAVPILRSIHPIQDILTIFKLYKLIKREKFDIVVAHSPKGGLLGMTAAYLCCIKTRVYFRHGLVFETEKGLKRMVLIYIEKITAFFSSKVVNVSESLAEQSTLYKLNRENKNCLLGKGTCNGIDIDKFKFRQKDDLKFVVGYVGRLSVDKGIVELVDAWGRFASNKVCVELLLVGPLDDRDPLPEKTLMDIKNNSSIKHTGYVKETASLYNEMDLFILPSYREGFGMVVLEASASCLPVITTKSTGCVNSIVENKTGIYTLISPESIADNIEFYYQNKDVRLQHGKNGRQFVKDYFNENYLFNEIEKKVFN